MWAAQPCSRVCIYSKHLCLFSLQFICALLMAQVQQGGLGLPWSISCHEPEHSTAQGSDTSAVTPVLFHARKSQVCAQQMGQSHRQALVTMASANSRVGAAAGTHAQGMRLINIPGHLKDTWEPAELPPESLSCVANNFRGPKVINYILHSEASAFPALLHTTVPTSPWIQAL